MHTEIPRPIESQIPELPTTEAAPALPPRSHSIMQNTTPDTQTPTPTKSETNNETTHSKWAVFQTPAFRYQLIATFAALGGTFMLDVEDLPFGRWNQTAIVAIQQLCNITLMFVTISLERVRLANAARRKAAAGLEAGLEAGLMGVSVDEKADVDKGVVVEEVEASSFMDEKAALAAREKAMDAAATKPAKVVKKVEFVPWTAEDAKIVAQFRHVAWSFCVAALGCATIHGPPSPVWLLLLSLFLSWLVILSARLGMFSTGISQSSWQA